MAAQDNQIVLKALNTIECLLFLRQADIYCPNVLKNTRWRETEI